MMPLTHKRPLKAETRLVHGILPVVKPVGMTSHDVVARVRHITQQRQIGHTGTLDPLADGLLVLCLGRATKIVQFLADQRKAYRATIRFGLTSPTMDGEGIDQTVDVRPVEGLTEQRIRNALSKYVGEIDQHVPLYSAVHVDGKRLHELARAGEIVETPTRSVNIFSLDMLDYQNPDLVVDVACSKGTYIRSLAADIGKELGCGGYLAALTRTSVGDISVSDALTLETLESRWSANKLNQDLLTIEEALPFGSIVIKANDCQLVLNGRSIGSEHVSRVDGTFAPGDTILVKNNDGAAFAVGAANCASDKLQSTDCRPLFTYLRVLN